MGQEIIAFLGGGNMATSLIGGLIADGCPPETLWVSEPDDAKRMDLIQRFHVQAAADNAHAAAQATTLVFSVKPQRMFQVVKEVAGTVQTHEPLILTIAAGVREPDVRRWLGCDAAVVRAMPNTPALVRSGATALYANDFVNPEQRSRAEAVLRAVGITLWLDDESLMDAVTALSGSGPAYIFLMMELLNAAGDELGLPREVARLLTLQTAFGSTKMALESPEEPAELRARVTSPGGTTEAAINSLLDNGIQRLFMEALKRARDRSAEIGKMLGDH